MSQPSSRSVDARANLVKGLKVLQSLGDAIPGPGGGVIKGIAGIGVVVLETAERVRANKEECIEIAQRAAQLILELEPQLSPDDISEDLRLRLEAYSSVLREVSETVTRIGAKSKWKRAFRSASVSEETKDCLNKLDNAYQDFLLRASISADIKLSTLIDNAKNPPSRLDSQTSPDWDEPDKIHRISVKDITFADQISLIKRKEYILRIQRGEFTDQNGARKVVVVRRIESPRGSEEVGRMAFEKEVEMRRDLLARQFARMFGYAMPSRRTRMIIIEDGTISAHDYLQDLSGLDCPREVARIMYEFVTGFRFLTDQGGSWEGGFRDITLNLKDKRLCIGGLGIIDNQSSNSGTRLWNTFSRLTVGKDENWASTVPFEEYAKWFSEAQNALKNWEDDKTSENAQALWDEIWVWSGVIYFDEEIAKTNDFVVGEIGWMEGKVWYPIPLEHQFAVSRGPEYNWMAHRLRGGEWELVVGDRVDGFTRWEFNFRPGEEIYLQMWDWTVYTDPIKEFFVGSAVSLSCEFGIDIHSLRLVTHAGYQTDASITVKQESLIAPSPYIYYFAHPPKHDSNNIDSPPGFWSFSPDPCLPANRIIQDSKIWFRREPRFQYYAITKPVLALLQSFDAYGFLPTSTSPCNSTVNTGDGDGDGNSHEGSPSPSIVQTESHFSVFSRGRHKRTTAGGLFSKFSQNQARGALEG